MGNSILNRQINSTNVQQNPVNGASPNMLQQLNQFKQTFSGNPQQTVMNLMRQGVMSNEQFQQLSQMARQFQNLMR